VIAQGSPDNVLTEEVLSRTFDRHLLTVGSLASVAEGAVMFDEHGGDGGGE
jgi:hypothetical protein